MGYDVLPKRLPQGADVELPASGYATIPAEKLREIFPNLSWLIDQGWGAFTTESGWLVWWYPFNTCPYCERETDLVSRNVVYITEWDAVAIEFFRCPECGHEWLLEYDEA